MNFRCPYCSRKIGYSTRLLEHRKGEHVCTHCKKPSNITQTSVIWLLFTLCTVFAGIIMLFYFTMAETVQTAYDTSGKNGFLVALFFGKYKEIKWIIWEILPYIILFFTAPCCIKFIPIKKYMEQTSTKIDLSLSSLSKPSESSRAEKTSRSAPKIDHTVYTGKFEDISSSSSGDSLEKTKSFTVGDMIDVTPPQTSVSASHTCEVPLRKYASAVREADRYEEERITRDESPKEDRRNQGNYSGNRKF
ncbi:MAG: hypothetical protein IJV88_05970 [Ruminococcus sp.]|nr:hypothetical protein [Ruminococcus sp.]